MADDTPQDQTVAPPATSDQSSAEEPTTQGPPKAEEQPTETQPTETPVETQKETEPDLTEEPKTETPPEIPKTPEPPKEEHKTSEETKPVGETKTEDKPTETKTNGPEPIGKPKEEVELEEPIKEKLPEISQQPKTNLDELRAKANKERQNRKQEHLSAIEKLAKSKSINNDDVRELLHISQTSATRYLEELTKQGKIKKSGKAKATTYSS